MADLEAKMREFLEMGFSEAKVKNALSCFDNDREKALNFLLTSNEDNDPEIAKAGNS